MREHGIRRTMFEELQFWDDVESRTPESQMATDEALFRVACAPVLRSYRWAGPAVTFGYSQKTGDVLPLACGLPIVRRWTGGGVVFHGGDLTLALIIPRSAPQAGWQAADLYNAIHESIRAVLAAPGVRLAGGGDVVPGAECFASPACGDLLEGSRKVCGGAMRRTRSGVIYQGSIQSNKLPAHGAVAASLAGRIVTFRPPEDFDEIAGRIAGEKYAADWWRNLR